MMRYLPVICLLFISLKGVSQDDLVKGYKLLYESGFDSTRTIANVKNLPFTPEQIAKIDRQANSMKAYYTLHAEAKTSVYQIKEKTYSEEYIKNMGDKMPTFDSLNYPMTIKKKGEQTIYLLNGRVPGNMAVKGTYQEINQWQLVEGDTIIGSYRCKKAIHTLEQGVEVWYTAEIPLPDGPSYYAGLPGLIVNVQNKRKQLYIQLISLQVETFEKAKIDIEIPEDQITYTEYRNKYAGTPFIPNAKR